VSSSDIWLRAGDRGGLLWTRQWICRLLKILGIGSEAENIWVSVTHWEAKGQRFGRTRIWKSDLGTPRLALFPYYVRKRSWAPDEVFGFFNCPTPCSHTMILGSTHPLTEINTRNLPGGKGRPTRKARRHLWTDYLVWGEPRRLTTLWAFTACYRVSFTFPIFIQRFHTTSR
jgi:hypothetical protein